MHEEEQPALPTEVEDDGLAADSGAFAFTPGDLQILKLIYEYRFLRREHVSLLTGRTPTPLHRRLLKLVKNRYLTTIRLPQSKHIYALGKAALPVLVEEGEAEPDLLSERLRTHELKSLFLKHQMMLVDLHVMLALATKGSELRLVSWREGRELFDSVEVSDGGQRTRLPIRPDAFFTIEDSRRPPGANLANFFLEADRSTATQTRFKDKLRAYWHYLSQGLHTKKYGIKTFRVLTVTLTHPRAVNLCALASNLLPPPARKFYLFTSLRNFSLEKPERIVEAVYLAAHTAGTDDRHYLIPPPKPSQTGTPVV